MNLSLTAAIFAACLAIPGAAADLRTPPFAIYYSFDQSPAGAVMNEMRTEFARITEPAGLNIQWREIGADTGEFANIFVVRFHGSCSMEGAAKEPGLAANERSLGETSIADGHVLPFADVQCDLLRRYLGPGIRGRTDSASVLARAIARVTAHELYHMMTATTSHCRKGVSQAEFSVADLTGSRFEFGAGETEGLRAHLVAWSEPVVEAGESGGR